MKPVKRILALALCIVCLMTLMGCNRTMEEKPTSGENTEGVVQTVEIQFSEKFLNVSGLTPDEWAASIWSQGSDQCESVTVDDTGKTVTMLLTDSQIEYWKSLQDEQLQALQHSLGQFDPNYRMNVEGDYSGVDLYFNLELSVNDMTHYIMSSEVLCAFQQMLNGTGADEWVVAFRIFNSDSEKLVTEGDSDTGLAFEMSDWEASE